MEKIGYKESVHLALEKALERYTVRTISREIGVNEQNLHGFKGRGHLGVDNLHRLSLWLTQHGYLEGAAPAEPDHPPEDQAIDAMAKDLEALAALLRSHVSKETKARAFAERVTFWYKSMQEYLKQIQKQKDMEGK